MDGPGGVDRFGLTPRPPSPPPAFFTWPWQRRWAIIHVVAAVAIGLWVLMITGSDGDEQWKLLVGITAPFALVPAGVFAVLFLRHRGLPATSTTPRVYAWGAGLSLFALLCFMAAGLGAWPLIVGTVPIAATLLVYALCGPLRRHRARAAVAASVLVVFTPLALFADLVPGGAAVVYTAALLAVVELVRLRAKARADPPSSSVPPGR